MTGRILNVEYKPYEWQGKSNDKWIVSSQEGSETKIYACYSKKIEGTVGKELEYTVKPNKNPSYPSTLELPKADGDKKPFVPYGKAQFTDIQAKVMLMSYAKDAVVAKIQASGNSLFSYSEIGDAIVAVYSAMERKLFNSPVSSDEVPF